MARASINVEVHYCPLAEIYMNEYGSLPERKNGSNPVIPLPILKIRKDKWEFPIGEDDLIIPIRFCPYCGKDLEDV